MAFATKYLFKFNSVHGVEHQIHIQKDGYSGSVIQRALGRSPKLKKKKNGCICGTSLEIYAECLVDGEFTELYTSDPQEYKVILYRDAYPEWVGYVSPELYSEPSIAPPYDVQIVATDGLGELKLKRYEAAGLKSIKQLLLDLLSATGITDKNIFILSQLKSSASGSTASGFLNYRINMDFMEGETYYDVLTRLLDSLHMTITQLHSNWLLMRETDVEINAYGHSSNGAIYITPNGTIGTTTWGDSPSVGKMGVADMWPIGNLSTAIVPAKRRITLTMPWHTANMLSNPNITSDTAWSKDKVRYNVEGKGGYAIGKYRVVDPSSWIGGTLWQDMAVNRVTSAFRVSARIYCSMGDQLIGADPRLACYMVFFPTDTTKPTRYCYKGYWTDTAPTQASDLQIQTPTDNGDFDNGNADTASVYEWLFPKLGDDYAGTLRVAFFGDYIRLFAASLEVELYNRGYQDTISINSDARGDAEGVEIAGGRFVGTDVVSENCLQGVILNSNTANAVQSFTDKISTTALNFMSVAALSYAASVALPRLRTEGKIDYPSDVYTFPDFIKFSGIYHLIETFEWDIQADEITISTISLPAASITVESETVKEMTGGSSSSGSSSSSGGSGGGGTSGTTMAEVQQWVTAQGYLTGITSAMVIAALGYVPASSSVDTQLFALAAPPTLTRRKGWTGHSTAGNMEDCIKVSHRLIGVEGFEAVLMVYRKRNSRSYMNGSIKVWKNKKGWAVAAGNYDICGYVPLASSSGYIGVQDLRTFILKRFVQFVGLNAQQVFDNMTATALDTTYRATTKSFTGPSSHMRFGIAMRTENPEFRRVVGEQTTVKDTCMEVYSQYTSKYEPRYLYSAVAPITAFLRTEGEGNYRNKLDFSLLGDSANVMININGGDIDFVDNSDPRSLYK